MISLSLLWLKISSSRQLADACSRLSWLAASGTTRGLFTIPTTPPTKKLNAEPPNPEPYTLLKKRNRNTHLHVRDMFTRSYLHAVDRQRFEARGPVCDTRKQHNRHAGSLCNSFFPASKFPGKLGLLVIPDSQIAAGETVDIGRSRGHHVDTSRQDLSPSTHVRA